MRAVQLVQRPVQPIQPATSASRPKIPIPLMMNSTGTKRSKKKGARRSKKNRRL